MITRKKRVLRQALQLGLVSKVVTPETLEVEVQLLGLDTIVM